ncbi:MAG: KH domain-containing protein [Bacilli bacterium]|nr:KH domain-containing protein [Bacilli bacterium]
MDLVLLTETIIKKIVSDSESVSVKEFESTEDDTVQIEVIVSSDDLGIVIGKNGRTINSIRTIVQASGNLNGNKRVKINVDSY